MGLSPRLEFRQTQTLTLTPQLMQSIRLLQFSHLELDLFVEAELLRNPLLERDGADEGEAPEPVEAPAEISAYEDTVDHADRIQSADSIAEQLRHRGRERLSRQAADRPESPTQWTERGGGGETGEAPDLDQFVASPPDASAST